MAGLRPRFTFGGEEMPFEIYLKPGFGRRIRKITAAAAAGLKHLYTNLYTSVGMATTPKPTVTTAPVVAGAGGADAVGTTFTVTPGVYTGTPAITRQWQNNGADIPGETGTTYDSTGDSAGDVVTCVETATNAGGSITSTSNGITLT